MSCAHKPRSTFKGPGASDDRDCSRLNETDDEGEEHNVDNGQL
jgi:hypothetical protein